MGVIMPWSDETHAAGSAPYLLFSCIRGLWWSATHKLLPVSSPVMAHIGIIPILTIFLPFRATGKDGRIFQVRTPRPPKTSSGGFFPTDSSGDVFRSKRLRTRSKLLKRCCRRRAMGFQMGCEGSWSWGSGGKKAARRRRCTVYIRRSCFFFLFPGCWCSVCPKESSSPAAVLRVYYLYPPPPEGSLQSKKKTTRV
jgi:hypothetical protein